METDKDGVLKRGFSWGDEDTGVGRTDKEAMGGAGCFMMEAWRLSSPPGSFI